MISTVESSLAKLLILGSIFKILHFVIVPVPNIGLSYSSKTRKSTLFITLLLKDISALNLPADFSGSLLI